MIINVSRAQTYLDCPTKEHLRWRLQRAPIFDGVPRVTGTAWHAGAASLLEDHIDGTWDVEGARNAAGAVFALGVDRAALSDDDLAKVDADMALVDFLLPHLTLPDGIRLFSVETELSAPSPNREHTFLGRPDALAVWNGKLWHVQHKTCSASTNWALFDGSISRSFHETTYLYLLNENRNLLPAEIAALPIGGTILLAVKKLSLKSAQANPAACFHTAFIPAEPPAVQLRALRTLERIADRIVDADMVHSADIPVAPMENRTACYGPFGNMPCAYLAVCQDRVSIADNAYFKTSNPLASYDAGRIQE